MLHLSGISKTFEENQVLQNIDFNINNGDIVGLVGKNGAGKSTIFKLIMDQLTPDSGSVQKDNVVIGYLPQYPEFKNQTVNTFLKETAKSKQDYEIETALNTVALNKISRDQNITSLSGGEKTKLYLAKLLLSEIEPNLLLLDEPTNNLDVEGLIWLEDFIASFNGAVLLTSHDRQFLDNTVDSIVELENGKLKNYGGNYSFYREQKEVEREAYERMYEAQQKKISAIEEDIDRIERKARQGEEQFSSGMPYQRRKVRKSAQQMASRKQRLQKFLDSEKHLDEIKKEIPSFIQLSGKTFATKSILFVKNVTKSFGERNILNDLTFTISGNEHVWLYGANGSGKSTLFQIVLNDLKPDSGTTQIGTNVNVGYFSQDRQDLDLNNTILDELKKIELTQTDAYKVAINFRFGRDELTKKISELSIGQRAKVSFAKLTSANYQLLILDEPTNHLEIETRETIEKALQQYQGALFIASHDRYFLEQINIDKQIILTA